MAHEKGSIIFQTCRSVCRLGLVGAGDLWVAYQFRDYRSRLFASILSNFYGGSSVALRIGDTDRSYLASPVEAPSLGIIDPRQAERPQLGRKSTDRFSITPSIFE